MAKRVRLTWNRNQDIETKFYRVYRSEKPDILPFNRQEFLVARVDHPDQVNPVKVENEELERYSERTYLLEHKNILPEWDGVQYPFVVEVDGMPTTSFSLDTKEGVLLFDDEIPKESVVISKEYTFDGVRIWDYGIEEDGKNYYGPEAKDTSPPFPPTNVAMEPDFEKNRIAITWRQGDIQGKKFYYRIDAAASQNHYSGLSEWKTAILKEPLADRPYLVERSLDGIKWNQIARVRQNIYYEYMMDRGAPEAIRELSASVYMYVNRTDAQVSLKWKKPYDNSWSKTPLYRIRSVNKVGAVSEPSAVVGPVPFKVDLKEIIIRRKENDGTLPTFDGPDAVTAGVITDLNITTFKEDVMDNREYIYALWVVDRAGNRSPLSYITVYIGDNTAPEPPTNITIDELQLIVG